MSKELQEVIANLGKLQQEYAKAIAEQIGGIKEAIIILAGSIARQGDINPQKLLDDFSSLVEINCPDSVPIAVLDVRAVLAQIAQERA